MIATFDSNNNKIVINVKSTLADCYSMIKKQILLQSINRAQRFVDELIDVINKMILIFNVELSKKSTFAVKTCSCSKTIKTLFFSAASSCCSKNSIMIVEFSDVNKITNDVFKNSLMIETIL